MTLCVMTLRYFPPLCFRQTHCQNDNWRLKWRLVRQKAGNYVTSLRTKLCRHVSTSLCFSESARRCVLRAYGLVSLLQLCLGLLLIISGMLALKYTQDDFHISRPPYFLGAFIVGVIVRISRNMDPHWKRFISVRIIINLLFSTHSICRLCKLLRRFT